MSKILDKALTFDDVLLLPGYSNVLPDAVDVSTYLTPEIKLNIPLLSAAMDTVTESRMAISMARHGGVGVIHKNMSVREQAREIDRVKKSESGMISDPITVHPDDDLGKVKSIMSEYRISGLPVVKGDHLVGIITNRDIRFVNDDKALVSELMTSRDLVTVPEGIDTDEAKRKLHQHRIEKLLVVDEENRLKGLITIKDINKHKKYPDAVKDGRGRLLAGAAIGVGKDCLTRSEALLHAGADFLVLDSAHGHSENILKSTRDLPRRLSPAPAGGRQHRHLRGRQGAHRGGRGHGQGRHRSRLHLHHPRRRRRGRAADHGHHGSQPRRARGGQVHHCRRRHQVFGDVVKALAVGANSCMMGSVLAGTDESPGETILYQGRTYKQYRGMGSIDAMKKGSSDRYFQEKSKKLVPEGIVGRVPYRGKVGESLYQFIGGLRSGMGYTGSATIEDLFEKSKLVQISSAGLRESHVHDVTITKESPNYRGDG